FHEEVRAGRAQVPPVLRPIVEASIPDRPIHRALDYLRLVGAEQARLQAMPEGFRRSSLGAAVEARLAVRPHAASRNAAARVRLLLQRRLDDIDAQLREAEELVVDVQWAERAQRLPAPRARKLPAYRVAPTDDEHVVWPFDGEFWRDELGSYRQAVVSLCGG